MKVGTHFSHFYFGTIFAAGWAKVVVRMAFFAFLLFVVLAFLLWLVLVGWRTLRLLFGVGRLPKTAPQTQADDDKARLQRIKAEIKRSGEYVDFEEVNDGDGNFEK